MLCTSFLGWQSAHGYQAVLSSPNDRLISVRMISFRINSKCSSSFTHWYASMHGKILLCCKSQKPQTRLHLIISKCDTSLYTACNIIDVRKYYDSILTISVVGGTEIISNVTKATPTWLTFTGSTGKVLTCKPKKQSAHIKNSLLYLS